MVPLLLSETSAGGRDGVDGIQDLAGQSLVLVESLSSPVSAINNPEAERQEEVSNAGGSSWEGLGAGPRDPPESTLAPKLRILDSHGPY